MVSKNYLWVHNLRFLLSGIFLFFSFNIYSQEPLKIKKITGGINFDGIPDEKIWQEVTPLPLVMHVPVYGIEPTEKTIERIAYDDENLYLSGIFYYTDPGMIRAVSKKRDTWIARCDWMCIIIDTFNDKENGVAFFTNPNGLRTDATVKNDAVGGDKDINKTWNTFWDVKTNIFSDGWSAEFRIPLSSLRFQIKEGKTTMGLLVFRYISSKSELSTFPAVSQDFGSYAFWKPSLFSEILFEELKPVKPFYITPYATSGLTQIGEINQQKTGYHMKTTPKFDAGLDVKYSITNNLTTDLTINTDFAQVEADDQQINLSRFSLYFPEKRVFFQEKADVFDFSFTNTIEGDNLFYSRRIGIYDGHPVRIYGGLRLTGSINDWAIGIVDMQTAPVENNPGENFGAFRTKRRIINQNSFIGGMVTSRLGMNGSYNIAYGLDGLFRVAGDEYLTLKLAQTFENGASNKIFEKSPSRFLLEWKRRNERGFSYDLVYSYSGENFNPGIGFESRENYQSFKGILQYGWFPGNNSFIKDHKISLTGHSIQSSIDQSMESAKGTLAWQFNAKKGFGGIITGTWFFEELTDTLFLGNNQERGYQSVPQKTRFQ